MGCHCCNHGPWPSQGGSIQSVLGHQGCSQSTASPQQTNIAGFSYLDLTKNGITKQPIPGMATQPWPLTMKAVPSYLQRDNTKCFETCCMISIHLFAPQQLIPLLDGPREPIVFMASLGIHQGMWWHKDGMPLLQWPSAIHGGSIQSVLGHQGCSQSTASPSAGQ